MNNTINKEIEKKTYENSEWIVTVVGDKVTMCHKRYKDKHWVTLVGKGMKSNSARTLKIAYELRKEFGF